MGKAELEKLVSECLPHIIGPDAKDPEGTVRFLAREIERRTRQAAHRVVMDAVVRLQNQED